MRAEAFETRKHARTMWVGTAWFACVAIGAAILRRMLGHEGEVAVAAAYGLGTIGMAWITVRPAGYPAWSWLGTSALLALSLVLGASWSPDARAAGQWMDMAWMFPLFFLSTTFTPAPAVGWCSPRARFAGVLLFGMGLVFSLILLGVTWLPGR